MPIGKVPNMCWLFKGFLVSSSKKISICCVTSSYYDCSDEDYVAHTKCVTEEERYAAKGSLPNGVVKKGEVKQESWVEMIKSIVDTEKNLPAALRNLLNNLSHHSNVPRKKAKFIVNIT